MEKTEKGRQRNKNESNLTGSMCVDKCCNVVVNSTYVRCIPTSVNFFDFDPRSLSMKMNT